MFEKKWLIFLFLIFCVDGMQLDKNSLNETCSTILNLESIRQFKSDKDPEIFINYFFGNLQLKRTKRTNIKLIEHNLRYLYGKINENDYDESKFQKSEAIKKITSLTLFHMQEELELQIKEKLEIKEKVARIKKERALKRAKKREKNE